ncbi:MAG TPA: phosphoribosyltransferase [Pyrinomonadaceae bacterium]|nr:phosphoribosyltransferase [Pyrinomonadaceae bacterium]
MITTLFKDRAEGGRYLAQKLSQYANDPNVIVLALPRGGVPVGYEVAQALKAPLDVFVVRKLGVPGFEECAMGAIASGGIRVLNDNLIAYLRVPVDVVDKITAEELTELERRERLYRGTRAPVDVTGHTVIIVDDGLATGSTMRAAVEALRKRNPKEIVVAVPVGARDTCDSFKNEVDTIAVCAITPEPFNAVGMWYRDFSQTTDAEVQRLLRRARQTKAAA